MRYVFRFLAVAPLVLTSCQEASGVLLADIAYQLTCVGTSPTNCAPAMVTGQNFDYVADDGDEVSNTMGTVIGTVEASCVAQTVADGVLEFTMRSDLANSYIGISGLRLDKTTGAFVGGACRVTAYDGISIYGGSTGGFCSAAAPAAGNPCQVTASSIDRNSDDGPSVELRLNCAGLPNQAEPTSQVSVRDSQSAANPAIIRFANCRGL